MVHGKQVPQIVGHMIKVFFKSSREVKGTSLQHVRNLSYVITTSSDIAEVKLIVSLLQYANVSYKKLHIQYRFRDEENDNSGPCVILLCNC